MRKNHIFEVPEHPVIAAMERDGEYPVREKRERWGSAVRIGSEELEFVAGSSE